MSSSKILKNPGKEGTPVSPYTIRDMGDKGKQARRKEQASFDADAIIREAKARKEAIEMEAYNEGMEKGREEGRKIALKQAEPLFNTLKAAIDELSEMRSSIIERNQEQLIETVFLICEKVIHRQIQISPDIILDTVRAAGRHLMETEEIRLHLHPSDFEYVREIESLLSKKLSGKKNIHIVEDSSLERGGVIIETEFGDIDATIRSQIEHMKEVVLDHV
ncbi:MAG TPA: FliH/SctL family protein [Deltaproteobacteria bacterium]|jgi:flagellar assembly protein FliH|nr:FliH/SctL family protein [Deltaproteobacteria bacterium]HQJ08183.1 FliH/SctL family protein [Deltaproteobacteria bacterium]